MIRYRLNGSLSPMREEEEYGRNDVRIELMTIQEFEADKEQISHKKLLLRQLEQIPLLSRMSRICRERRRASASIW